ncbi:GvpL/GvpF family gas vesicle protein [Solidesulfovibrio sp. C21]|uniref:GvpL/GvpF family gas vesicle protein n=1 Tax=Solidesulfovibrio sp. C21 TaxID=3398613 RepID=UPI0039FC404C
MANVVYLFCLTRLGGLGSFAGTMAEGLGPVAICPYRDIAAVVSEVSLATLGGENDGTAEASARTLRQAMGHEAVVEGVMRTAGVLPTRLGTVFSSWDALEQVLRTAYATILSFLEKAGAAEEWAVKVYWDRTKGTEALWAETSARQEAYLTALPPGKRYLEEQRLRKGLGREASRKMQQYGREIEECLEGVTADCRRRELQSSPAGEGRAMLLNLACWVPKENGQRFRDCLETVKGAWGKGALIVEDSGPWPPYSFAPCLETEGPA